MDYRSKLIAAGVNNLKAFGYPGVTAENILTDVVYRAFFARMLEDEANVSDLPGLEKARKSLLAEVAD